MSGLLDPQDHQIPSRKLNDVNDPNPGVIVSTANVSGSIIQPYPGQVGKRLVCSYQTALALSDTAIGTLYEGIYQYVQFLSTESAAAVRGQLVYWSDYDNYIVTTDIATTTNKSGLFAGVILNVVTAGNYGYIQIAGKASVLFKATAITKGSTVAAGDLVLADGTTSPRGDVLNDASGLTMALGKLILGVAIATPTFGAVSTVDLWNLRQAIGGKTGF